MTAATITNKSAGENAANSAYPIPFTVVTGRTLIIQVSYGNAITGITGISDSGGNIWVEDYSDTAPTNHSRKLYRCQTVGTVPTTVTVTGTAGTLAYWIYEITGLATVSPLESVTTVAGVSGTSHSSAYTTLSAEALVILTAICNSAKGTHTATAPFTGILMSRTTHLGEYLADAGAAGTYSAAYTTSNTVTPQNLMIVYKAFSSDPTVSTVTSNASAESGNIVFTVTLTGATTRNTVYSYSWGGTATSADYTQALTTGMCARTGGASGNVTVLSTNITAETGVSAFTITVPITNDALDEDNETIVLTVGGVASTGGTITDDDASPALLIPGPVTVDSGDSVVASYTLGAVSGRVTYARLVLTDGTAVGGTNYTNIITDLMLSDGVTISAGVLTIPAGVGGFTITIPTAA